MTLSPEHKGSLMLAVDLIVKALVTGDEDSCLSLARRQLDYVIRDREAAAVDRITAEA